MARHTTEDHPRPDHRHDHRDGDGGDGRTDPRDLSGVASEPQHPTERTPLWSRVGDEVLILDETCTVVHRLHGAHAAAAEFVLEHPSEPVPSEHAEALAQLHDAGVLDRTMRVSRRRLIAAGAVMTAAAGMGSVMLPSAAAASSEADEVFGAAGGYTPPEGSEDGDFLAADRDEDGDIVLYIQSTNPPKVDDDEGGLGTEDT
jgi:hypothetical protein